MSACFIVRAPAHAEMLLQRSLLNRENDSDENAPNVLIFRDCFEIVTQFLENAGN